MPITISNTTLSKIQFNGSLSEITELQSNGMTISGSLSPSYIVVGHPRWGGNDPGSIWIYNGNNLSEEPIQISVSTYKAQLGSSVSINKDYIVSGGPRSYREGSYTIGANSGYVVVWDIDNALSATSIYEGSPTILRDGGQTTNYFYGWDVFLENDYLLVGEFGPSNTTAGRAYFYNINDISSDSSVTLNGTNTDDGDGIGRSVAGNSSQIIIGAPGDDTSTTNSGAVYVFDKNDLNATPTKLIPADIGSSDEFGYSVAATDSYIVVGARGYGGLQKGAVYVYDATDLSATPTRIEPDDLESYDYFGQSVSLNGRYIVVGAPSYSGFNKTGKAYVYDITDLSATPTKLTPSDLANNDLFGDSVAISLNKIVIGAPRNDEQNTDAGAVYVYDINNLSADPTKLAPSGLESSGYFGDSVAAI